MNALKEKSDRAELRVLETLDKANEAIVRARKAEENLASAQVDYHFFLGEYLEAAEVFTEARKAYLNSRLETK